MQHILWSLLCLASFSTGTGPFVGGSGTAPTTEWTKVEPKVIDLYNGYPRETISLEYSMYCKDHTACVALQGIAVRPPSGRCCPRKDGTYEDCCDTNTWRRA